MKFEAFKIKTFLFIFFSARVLLPAQNTSCVKFDGIDDYVFIGTKSNLDITGQITLEAWVKCDSLQSHSYPRIIDKFNFVNKTGYNLIVNGGRLFMEFFSSDGTARNVYGKKNLLDNQWHHVAGTYDGNTLRIYIDGKQDQFKVIGAQSISITGNPLTFGSSWDGKASLPLKGSIDEVRIWNIARDSFQILAAKDSCIAGSSFGLAGVWGFNENTDTLTSDLTPNSNQGILRNGATWSTQVGFPQLCSVMGILDLLSKTIPVVYPNPVNGHSILDLQNLPLPCAIEIFDANGRMLRSDFVSDSQYPLEISGWQAGMYFIRFRDYTYSPVLKFIIR